jgi:hypothetical protein
MAIPDDPKALLLRKATADALTLAGFPIAKSTLAKLACRGTGPKFRKYGKYPLYEWSDALEWARSRLSRPVRSTAELDCLPAA